MSNSSKTERPPIVVVMGHVDHGKSTLLDFIRKSNTVDKEAGGITQHVAAYEVEREVTNPSTSLRVNKRITFIDTPGHAAFGAIRARGANVADIAILVVAADDGVKAQTLEALGSIREAKIPFIVAINKIDKPNANIERTQASLLEQGVYLEKMGGDVPWTAISAKAGTGVEDLLDVILLVAELQEYKADASLPASGYVIEAHRDQKRGIAATLIITEGTLTSGMAVLAGSGIAPVRIMENHAGQAVKSATFSSPISLIGFDTLPEVGAEFTSHKNKRDAEAARDAAVHDSPKAAPSNQPESTDADGQSRYMLPVIIRADASGSLEAIEHELLHIGDEFAGVTIVQSGIGTISENDVKAALASSTALATLIGFNVKIDSIAEALARQHDLPIATFSIIYKLTEYIEERLLAATPKRTVEEVTGRARVLKSFGSTKNSHVIGAAVSEGTVSRNSQVRILRRKVAMGLGKISNLQSSKQNVDKVDGETEFGAQIEAPFEIAQGDVLECFTTVTK